ncbi:MULTISPECIES: GIY-YIG nuclease family protein [Marinovum]|uniref:GIY-YIG nuclease family protein n=1 Tax=Marinovum TaxID=367771 RepID=UPI00237AEEE1|nr:GIY-YIG nuclease family protein [Marinovum sp. PR37]MDD9744852.1 GIY-YIG nuclease family protein [Marinovum sp. PR37]
MGHFVYILASRPGGAIYIGRSRNLRARIAAHCAGLSRHTERYNIRTLVWFEAHADFETSLLRERRLKHWRRAWKDALIMEHDPQWRDITHLVPE